MSEHDESPEQDERDPGGLPGEPPVRGADDPRERPPDPAGTRPKYDPESLLPATTEPLVAPTIEGTAVDEDEPHSLLPERVAGAGAVAPASRDEQSPHAPRFQFMLGALVALGLAAVVTVVAIAINGPTTQLSGPRWSLWRPTGDGGAVAEQIAKHVGREYHLSTGDQLVLVTGGPLEVAGLPLTIALRQSAAKGGDISLVDGKGALYRLCGLGPNCAIAEGKPSRQRHLLLRREALELSLYTFRYTDVDNVVVFMPPRLAKKPSKTPRATQALFFQRKDVDPELAQPLDATLTRTAPKPSTVTRSPDAGLVNRITEARLFLFSLTQANQDNRAFLVLEPFDSAPR